MTFGQLRCTAVVLGMTLAPVEGRGEGNWRYWTAADGMVESFSRAVNRGNDGEIWVRHGTVGKMSILDGRSVRQIADPWREAGDRLARQRHVWPDESGGAWAIENLGLMRFEGGRWKLEWQGDVRDLPLEMARVGKDGLVVLFAGRVAMYEIALKRWVTLREARRGKIGSYREIAAGFEGDVWIAGTDGIGRLRGNLEWEEWKANGVGLKDLDHVQAGMRGEVFVSGEMKNGKGRGTALLRDGKFALVAEGLEGGGFGWRGPEDSIWLLDGRRMFRIDGGRKEEVERRGRLASEIFSVLTESNGGFWLGTVDGLVHREPGLWRTPAGVAEVRNIVHDIIEDKRGRLWFAATEYLVKLEGDQWTKYELPRRMPTHNLMSRALTELPDGRLMVKTKEQSNPDRVLIFDPEKGSFTELKMPGGRTIQFFRGRQGGTVLVASAPGFRLDEFDGEKFRMVADLSGEWHGGTLKDVEEEGAGKIWLAGSAGGGVIEEGKYKQFRAEEYIGEIGFFSVIPNKSGGMRFGGRTTLMAYNQGQLSVRKTGLDRVRSMAYDRTGRFWMATAAGMERIEGGRWMRNGEADGLNSDMVYKVFEDSKGRLWAGTAHGISRYDGVSDREAPQTRLKLSQIPKEASPGGVIRMVFAGLDKWKQTESEHLLYSYRLDGGEWSTYAEGAGASFEGLTAGDHGLEMKAMDRNGNIEETTDSIRFGVPMPWYREGGFFVVVVIGGVSIISLFGVAVVVFRQRGALVEELERARAAAETASRQKSIFLANMSHEIRTPMNAILGMSELALKTSAGEEQQEYLKLVTSSATELLNLLNDILDLSKVEAGKLDLVEGNFDLHGCVEGVVRTLKLKAREKGLEIRVAMATGTRRYVFGDEHRLRQILFNLVGNSLKFSEHGEVWIEVEEGEGTLMSFVVRDEGEGIAIAQQERIFQSFVQADGSTTRKHGGTGLGLAISSELVKKMGGTICVESPWRKSLTEPTVAGSAMHFTIELKQGSAPEKKGAKELEEATSPMRVLVAEDNLVNQKLIDLLLKRDGHTVTLVGNGQEAIDALKSLTVDLVLMDVQMPELDGLEATRQIREGEMGTGVHLTIVAITANALDGDREKCMEAGMDDYLTKPLRLAELRRVLNGKSSVN